MSSYFKFSDGNRVNLDTWGIRKHGWMGDYIDLGDITEKKLMEVQRYANSHKRYNDLKENMRADIEAISTAIFAKMTENEQANRDERITLGSTIHVRYPDFFDLMNTIFSELKALKGGNIKNHPLVVELSEKNLSIGEQFDFRGCGGSYLWKNRKMKNFERMREAASKCQSLRKITKVFRRKLKEIDAQIQIGQFQSLGVKYNRTKIFREYPNLKQLLRHVFNKLIGPIIDIETDDQKYSALQLGQEEVEEEEKSVSENESEISFSISLNSPPDFLPSDDTH
jgi:hypothetical protein